MSTIMELRVTPSPEAILARGQRLRAAVIPLVMGLGLTLSGWFFLDKNPVLALSGFTVGPMMLLLTLAGLHGILGNEPGHLAVRATNDGVEFVESGLTRALLAAYPVPVIVAGIGSAALLTSGHITASGDILMLAIFIVLGVFALWQMVAPRGPARSRPRVTVTPSWVAFDPAPAVARVAYWDEPVTFVPAQATAIVGPAAHRYPLMTLRTDPYLIEKVVTFYRDNPDRRKDLMSPDALNHIAIILRAEVKS